MNRYCIGIDLGGTYTKFGLLDEQRRLSDTFQLPTPADRGADGVVGQMAAGARRLIDAAKANAGEVLAVGIGSPGPLSVSRGRIFAMPNIPGMEDVPLRDRISEALDLPAVLENDANAAAFGEYICGAGKGAGDMVMLTLGTGLGSGFILNGRILHGVHEIGGELGHLVVQPGGRQCACGQKGCLERYCSATYLAMYAQRRIEEGDEPTVLRDVLRDKGAIDAKDIADARRAGDKLANQAWDECAYYLAVGCVNVCRLFDPDEIVLAGGLTRAGDELLHPVVRHFHELHWHITEVKTEITLARLGTDAGIIGAAGVAWQQFA